MPTPASGFPTRSPERCPPRFTSRPCGWSACSRSPVERHLEEEPERRHGRVNALWLQTGLGQMQLERAQLFRRRGVGGTAEEARELLDSTDILALRIGHEPAHVHVFEHALAQRADGLLAHWGLLS